MPAQTQKWITKREAEQKYGISARQLERYVADGRLQKQVTPRGPGEARDPVCVLESDLVAIKAGAKPALPAALATARAVQRMLPASVATSQSDDATLAAGEEKRYRRERPRPPMWCTLHEAARYSGLPIEWLRRAAELGAVHVIDVSSSPARHVWRFHRDDLATAKRIE